MMSNAWLWEEASPYGPDACDGKTAAALAEELDEVQFSGLPPLPPGVAAVSLCPPFFIQEDLLVMHKCECLGDTDSYLMQSGGAVLLHEFMHWRALTSQAPGFDDFIGPTPEIITDWKPGPSHAFTTPKNGYGPQRSAELVTHANGDARRNADNYMWYALSKYWGDKCAENGVPKLFGVSTNNNKGGERN